MVGPHPDKFIRKVGKELALSLNTPLLSYMMGSLSLFLFVAIVVMTVLGNPLLNYEEDRSQEYYDDISLDEEEEPYPHLQIITPIPSRRAAEPPISSTPDTIVIQQCHMRLLRFLQEACTAPKYAHLRAYVLYQQSRASRVQGTVTNENGGKGVPLPSSGLRRENVVNVCCDKNCTVSQVLAFCPLTMSTIPTTTTTTTTTTPAPPTSSRQTSSETQSPLLPLLVAFLAWGLPKQTKEPFRQHDEGMKPIDVRSEGHHQQRHNMRPHQARKEEWEVETGPSSSSSSSSRSSGSGRPRPKFGVSSYTTVVSHRPENAESSSERRRYHQHHPSRGSIADGERRPSSIIQDERVSFEIGTGGRTWDGNRH